MEGFQNWGLLALGVFLAREISGFDENDTDVSTLSVEYRSVTTMLSYDTFLVLKNYAVGHPELRLGGYNEVTGSRFITPASIVMQALIARYRQDPRNRALAAAINQYVLMHKQFLMPVTINGSTFYDYLDPSKDLKAANQLDTFGGYFGQHRAFAFINGRAAMAMFEWYDLTGNAEAFDVGSKLVAFLRSFAPLWADPDPTRFPGQAPGQFVGHIHSYLQAAHAFTEEAFARLKTHRQDDIAQQDIRLANDIYQFVKRRTQGEMLGTFGEMDGTDDMIRLGIDLSELGAGPYWDEVERWTRNTLADRQIDEATAQHDIGNRATGVYSTDHVGDKVTGMWFSDATHSLAIPPRAWMYNLDDATNPMHAVYEVWAHAVEVHDATVQVNFDLNRASKYLDVKSDLPYRGQIAVVMKKDIGAIKLINLRIPEWVDRNRLSVVLRDGSGEHPLAPGTNWNWSMPSYVAVSNIVPAVSYVVRFPIKVFVRSFTDIRSIGAFWYEGDYPSPANKAAEVQESFVGTFRGDTLVDATPRPASGIPRYQRQQLANLPSHDVAPPIVTVQRFVFNPTP